MATWTTEVLDGGRMVLLKVTMDPAMVQAEVKALLTQAGRRPMKGFRSGKIAESVLRRIHGRRVLEQTRNSLIAKSRDGSIKAAAEKHGFDPKKASRPPSNVKFSEEDGLVYEILVTGLSIPSPSAAPGVVVDLTKKES